MKPSTEKQQRARRGKACILTALHQACGRAEIVTIEGVKLQLCPMHRQRVEAIVADSKRAEPRHQRTERRAA